jgi:hypothetical protein
VSENVVGDIVVRTIVVIAMNVPEFMRKREGCGIGINADRGNGVSAIVVRSDTAGWPWRDRRTSVEAVGTLRVSTSVEHLSRWRTTRITHQQHSNVRVAADATLQRARQRAKLVVKDRSEEHIGPVTLPRWQD